MANNSSFIRAGGIFTETATTISNSTIINNSSGAASGVGGLGYNVGADSVVSIANTLIADNTADGINRDTRGYGADDLQSANFNFVEASADFDENETDILGLDPLISSVTLVNDRTEISVDSLSPIIDTGSSSGSGDTSINSKVVDATPNIGGYVLNTQSDKVFWGTDVGDIYRSDKLFTFAQKIVSGGAVLDGEVDEQNQRVYWLDAANQAIVSSRFDGSNTVTERLVDADAVGFALDIDNDRFFVSAVRDDGRSEILQYFGLDSYTTDEEQRVGALILDIGDILVDLRYESEDDLLYWIEAQGGDDSNLGTLRPNLFGEDAADVRDENFVGYAHAEVENPYAFVLNSPTNQVYWSEPELNQLNVFDVNAVA